jgi:hypothetical protein
VKTKYNSDKYCIQFHKRYNIKIYYWIPLSNILQKGNSKSVPVLDNNCMVEFDFLRW